MTPDDAGPADAGRDFVAAEALELFRNRRRRAVHVVLKFRMGVEVSPPRGDFRVQVGNAVHDWHRMILVRRYPAQRTV